MSNIYFLVLALFVLTPYALLFGSADFAEFSEILSAKSTMKALWTTVYSSGFGALFSLLFGILFARVFAFVDWRMKRFQRLMLLIPYLIPNFILATAFVVSWNPQSGLLNWLFEFPLYGATGLVTLFGISHMPVAFLLLEEKYKKFESSLLEAAQMSGASRLKTFTSVELPILLPTLFNVLALCFALNISAFAIPAWIGAPAKEYTLTYKIFQTIQVEGADGIGRGAILSMVLFLFALLPVAVGFVAGREEKKFIMVTGKSSRPPRLELSRAAFLGFQGFYFACLALFWLLPLSVLFLSTLVPPGCLQESGLTCLIDANFNSYRYILFEMSDAREAFFKSLFYAFLSTFLILVTSIVTIVFAGRGSKLKIADILFSLPIATPGAVLALALIVTYSGQFGINFYNTAAILVVAYFLKHANLAFQTIRGGYMGLSTALTEAARMSGASKVTVWRRILIPLISPEILGALFLVMIPILGELTMSIFLASPNFRPIGVVIFDLQDYADQISAAALSIILVVAVLALNSFARLISRGKVGY